MSSAVSIIFPTFNRLEFLRPAIESVFPRSFEDWVSPSLHATTGRLATSRNILASGESRTHPGFR
jgi:hypothetical protein